MKTSNNEPLIIRTQPFLEIGEMMTTTQEQRQAAIERITRIGEKVIAKHGNEACYRGYGTDDPFWVGRYAIQYGDYDTEQDETT